MCIRRDVVVPDNVLDVGGNRLLSRAAVEGSVMLTYLVDVARGWAAGLSADEILMLLILSWSTATVATAVIYASSSFSIVRASAAYVLTAITLVTITLIVSAGLLA
jgi:hypothetical protein